MIENLPSWIELSFILISVVAIIFFYYANAKPKLLTALLVLYGFIQCGIATTGIYANTAAIPPRLPIGMLPVLLFFIYSFRKDKREELIQSRNLKASTFLHTIRIPVEIILLYLFIHKTIPELMTFEGRNFDILAGLTAPIVGALVLYNKMPRKALLAWNIICLGLVTFIAINGVLSAEFPFQQFAFDQPNIALIYSPFVLLPTLVVPIVMHTHIIDILKLLRG